MQRRVPREALHGGSVEFTLPGLAALIQQGWIAAPSVPMQTRINDVYVVRELSATEASDIVKVGSWPDDFKQYESLLRLGQEAGHRARFVDPRCNTLVRAVSDLVAHRLAIEDREIAELLNVAPDAMQPGCAKRRTRELKKTSLIRWGSEPISHVSRLTPDVCFLQI